MHYGDMWDEQKRGIIFMIAIMLISVLGGFGAEVLGGPGRPLVV